MKDTPRWTIAVVASGEAEPRGGILMGARIKDGPHANTIWSTGIPR